MIKIIINNSWWNIIDWKLLKFKKWIAENIRAQSILNPFINFNLDILKIHPIFTLSLILS